MENWTICDPDTGDVLTTSRSKNKLFAALRHLVSVVNLIPNQYEIFDANGEHGGDIEGQFSLRDTHMGSRRRQRNPESGGTFSIH